MSFRVSESYTYVFYVLRSCFKAMADDNLHDWKALLVVCFFEGAAIVSVVTLVEEFVDKFLPPDDLLFGAGPLAIALGLSNYFFLLHNDRWRRFEAPFRAYSKIRRRVGMVFVVLSMIAIAALFVISVLSIDPVAKEGT